PHALEPPDQHLVVGVDEHHPRVEAADAQVTYRAGEVGGEGPAAYVEDHRGVPGRPARVVGQLGHPQHQRLRQVVDDVVADVLQGPGDRAAATAGHAGDDHQIHVRPGRVVRVAARPGPRVPGPPAVRYRFGARPGRRLVAVWRDRAVAGTGGGRDPDRAVGRDRRHIRRGAPG